MIDLMWDALLISVGLFVLGLLMVSQRRNLPLPKGLSALTMTGVVFVLFGRLLESKFALLIPFPHLAILVIEAILFIAGLFLLTYGTVRWLPLLSAKKQVTMESGKIIQQAAHDLQSSRELIKGLLDSSLTGAMVLRAMRDDSRNLIDFECRLMNNQAQHILGFPSSQLIGKGLLSTIPCLRNAGLLDHISSVIETGLPYRGEKQCGEQSKDNWYEIAAIKLGDGLVVTFGDITVRKRAEHQLVHAARHDTLTGLPNRSKILERLQHAINRAQRVKGYKYAVLFLDFDRFKIINDSLGHEIGDQLLISIAERLQSNLRSIDTASRSSDAHVPARLGGDEFVVLLEGIASLADAELVASRLLKELAKPHKLSGNDVVSTASIGIVFDDGRYTKADDVLRNADAAMYRAKTSGKARYVVFDDGMHAEVVQQLSLETDLRAAVEVMNFTLSYEPVVELATGRIAGVEALIRWPHPTRGLISPGNFIPLAEEVSLIHPIGEWVLKEACKAMKNWLDRSSAESLASVHVNLSHLQLHHPRFVASVREALQEANLAPQHLSLEITESMVMNNRAGVDHVLKELHDLGIKLVMDDFGTGDSSLRALQAYPIDVLKIDGVFVRSAAECPRDQAILRAIVQLGTSLSMRVIAEGIETREQLSLLQSLHCDLGQGRLFSDDLTQERVENLLHLSSPFSMAA